MPKLEHGSFALCRRGQFDTPEAQVESSGMGKRCACAGEMSSTIQAERKGPRDMVSSSAKNFYLVKREVIYFIFHGGRPLAGIEGMEASLGAGLF